MRNLFFACAMMMAFFAFVSCDEDDPHEEDKKENYSEYSIIFSFEPNGKMFYFPDGYKEADMSVRPLREGDRIDYVNIYLNGEFYVVFDVKLSSFAYDGISSNKFVIEWKHDKIVTVDTITYEIEKTGDQVYYKKLFINNVLSRFWYDGLMRFVSDLTKTPLAVLDVYNENRSHGPRIEVQKEGLKYSYWLTDADGRETNVFSHQDVNEENKGFSVHLSVTNLTNEKQYASLVPAYYARGGVFDIKHRFCGEFTNKCESLNDKHGWLLPGETLESHVKWCVYNEDEVLLPEAINKLPPGKYYVYSQHAPLSTMILDFEIK